MERKAGRHIRFSGIYVTFASVTIIQVENNPFVGIVISAETEDRNVFFGREDLFKPAKEEVCLP